MSNLFLRNDGTFQQVDYASITGTPSTSGAALTSITDFTTADITLAASSTTVFFTGPVVTQGSSGTWFASGSVAFTNAGGAAKVFVKLWDGTSVMASGPGQIGAAGFFTSVALSGIITSPSSNIKISASTNSSTVLMSFNLTGASADSNLTVIRIA